MDVKRHRKNLKTFEDCFYAKRAVDWVHRYLIGSPFFGKHEVSRFQAVQLLRKFLRCEIIKKVDTSEGDFYEFLDNRDLYCFASHVKENMPLLPCPEDINMMNGQFDTIRPNENRDKDGRLVHLV
jgi:hypothetical protein